MITSRDVFDSLEPSRKLALWAYAKRVHGKHNLFHFTFKGTVFFVFSLLKREPNCLFMKFWNSIYEKPKKGASDELYYDIALLSGARIPQIKKMKDEDDDEETQALIRKQEKTLLKVLKYKLKDCWPYHMDHILIWTISYGPYYHMDRLNSEEPIFFLWRFFLNQLEILIQWKILNLMI